MDGRTDGRTDRVDVDEELTGHTWHWHWQGGDIFGSRGGEGPARLARVASVPLRQFEPFKKAACISNSLCIHQARQLRERERERGKREERMSCIQPLMMPLLSKMLEGRTNATRTAAAPQL